MVIIPMGTTPVAGTHVWLSRTGAGWGVASVFPLPHNHPSAVLLKSYQRLKRAELKLFQGKKTHRTLSSD